ncbi:MAG: Ig-like domain-containing protein [Caldilineaceae bacterium]
MSPLISLGVKRDHTLTISPTNALAFGASYQLTVAEAAQPASQQGNLRERFTQTFDVVPLPAILSTMPTAGASDVPPDMTVSLRFNTVLSETTILPNISITPTLTTTQIATYYRSWEDTVDINWFREAGTTYTVTVGADVADLYGNTLGEPYSFSFTTGDQSAFVRMGIDRFTHLAPTPKRASAHSTATSAASMRACTRYRSMRCCGWPVRISGRAGKTTQSQIRPRI